VGGVKITRIVEMDLPVPAKVIPQATPEELRKLAWLYPHFVSEDDTTLKLSIHALLVEASSVPAALAGTLVPAVTAPDTTVATGER
jgi:hypothetical protein